ncbi:hypothetical protein G5V59_27285 [Nocardioides sp. W3-2-3]|uniref:hypothetical protein n=1 Tax=Nocardioides convexus TaxID=2712224 RepID=UPI0024183E92|nr:hypothetical protein [Nocardioides convexus]NHA02088.1 hypothetical protein [Nocardioides convexus]
MSPPPRARRPSGAVLAIAGAAVIAGLGLLGAALLFTGSDEPERSPRAEEPRTSETPTTEEQPRATRSAEPVTAADLERFARDYVRTASDDPGRGFALLTRDYQQQSPRYREVWTAIDDPEILRVTPDPEAMSVVYTYRYSLPGGVRRTEDITLRLVRRGERLLIAGASARRP